MSRIILNGTLLVVFLVSGVVVSAQVLNGPRIEVKQEHYAMGSIVQGTRAVHVFEVRNSGSEPLIIESLKPS